MQGKEYELVNQLAYLLRKNGDRILNGESKLSLTTQSLSLLNVSFRRYSDAKHGESSRTKRQKEFDKWRVNVQYLHDFITKAISLKITQTSATMQGPILISRFRSVEVLELKKVPIHMLEGLHKLRGQIRTIIVTRCLISLHDLFEACGGDQSSPMSWPQLKSAFLSYNGLKKIDSSLRLLPGLEVIDLSHNDLQRTENYMEHLTDIIRVNLGYNTLETVPSFSLTTKSKLRTLVLRNNCLDNIEGIEDFINLEELDLADNCLCDHSCLVVLSYLNKLQMLNLQGNPLSFHDSHRTITFSYLSIASGTNVSFVLDGKKLSSTERQMNQRSIAGSRQPSREFVSSYPDRVLSREGVSASYTFSDSDDIAMNLKVGSPARSRSKKRKSRAKARLSDEDGLDSSVTEYSSRDSSRVPSPNITTDEEPVKTLSTKEEIQVLRDHYGENWLQVMAAKQEETLGSSASSRDLDKTEDDIYLNESIANISVSSPRKSKLPEEVGGSIAVERNKQDQGGSTVVERKPQDIGGSTGDKVQIKEADDDIEVLPEPSEKDVANDSGMSEPRTEQKSSGTEPKSEQSFYSIYSDKSFHGSEWKRISGEDGEEYYGAESEPFIVMLPGEKLQQLIVSMNNRYLIEKDLNGQIIELLDLKCLEAFQVIMETVDHENISEEISLPVCRIKFDYLRKDRRERKYVMEDGSRAQEFKDLLQPFLDAKEIDKQMKGLLQCLKCSHQFNKTEAEVKINIPDKKQSIAQLSKDDSVKYICPKCGSEMVVGMDVKELPTSLPNTPVGSLISSPGVWSPLKDKENIKTGSPLAKSSPLKSYTENTDKKEPSAMPPVMSNSAFVSFTEKQTIQKSFSTGTAMCDMEKSHDNPEYVRNTSWSEVTKSLDHNSVKKRLSVDSDITILTNDSSSIAVISESSYETIEEQTYKADDTNGAKNVQNLNLPLNKHENSSSTNSFVENVSRKLSGISEEVKTPVGSPLSSSICSSMVSSIYENTLTSPSTENLHQVADNDSHVNNNDSHVKNNDSHVKNNDSHARSNDSHANNGNPDFIYDAYKTCDNDIYSASNTSDRVDNQNSSLNGTNETLDTSVQSNNDSSSSPGIAMGNDSILSNISDVDFTKLDHRFKLYLMMNYLEDSVEEKVHGALKVDIVQYMEAEEYSGFLVISTERIFIFRIDQQDSEDYDSSLTCVENQPITELQYIDIGLGYQSLRFEFSTECSSYTFLLRDEGRCKHFINLVTSVLQETAFSENSKLEGISKYNAVTMENLTSCVMEGLEEGELFNLVRYLCGLLMDTDDETTSSVGIVVTEEELILMIENYQWPLPRLQAPLSDDVKGQQFTIKDRQKINNIATVETCEDDTTQVRLTFFNEESQQEVSWHISMATDSGVLSLVNAIREPWENEFGIDLDVTPVTF